MLSVKAVSHSFGTKQVLHDVSFDVGDGEIVVIMGSSGGGKTTLVKCIAGLLRPTKGDITLDDVSVVRDPSEAHRLTGLVFQYAALFDYLDVTDNVLFGVRRQRRLSKKDEKELVSRLLEDVGLTGSEHLMPSELSGGMRKRVGLARALALEPRYLLYDEPTSGLDPVTAYAIDQLIVETRDRTQATSIVVSHDVTSVLRVADRIAFLDGGHLVFFGPPEEFRSARHGGIRDLVDKARAESLTES